MIYQLGRLTREVSLQEIDVNGEKKSVLNNSLAIKIDKENTAYINIAAWSGLAERIAKYYKKGDEILLKGEIRNKKSTIEDKEIVAVYMLVSGFEFTHGNKRDEDSAEYD